jgi:hypothetical protein
MKNIYKFLILIFAIGIASCKDKDTDESVNTLSVIESDVSFPASGGNDGYIKVNLPDGYTATSAQSWCTLSVDKDVVKVSATANSSLGSRAALITLTYGSQKEEVLVYQHGTVLYADKESLIFKNNDGPENPQTVNITTTSTLTPTVTVADTWLTATLDGNVLTVYCNSVAEEERTTTVTLAVGEAVVEITAIQKFSIAYEDYLGNWTLKGTDYDTGEEIEYSIVITQREANQSYDVAGWWAWDIFENSKFTMEYDPETQGVSIYGLQDAGLDAYGDDYAVYFVSVIYEPSFGLEYNYGDDVGLKGKLTGDRITWEYQDVYDYFYETTYKAIGMAFILPEVYPDPQYIDHYILENAVLIKN